MAAKAENKSYRRMAWQEARDGGADDGVRTACVLRIICSFGEIMAI
jgi:hypothetical protein